MLKLQKGVYKLPSKNIQAINMISVELFDDADYCQSSNIISELPKLLILLILIDSFKNYNY